MGAIFYGFRTGTTIAQRESSLLPFQLEEVLHAYARARSPSRPAGRRAADDPVVADCADAIRHHCFREAPDFIRRCGLLAVDSGHAAFAGWSMARVCAHSTRRRWRARRP